MLTPGAAINKPAAANSATTADDRGLRLAIITSVSVAPSATCIALATSCGAIVTAVTTARAIGERLRACEAVCVDLTAREDANRRLLRARDAMDRQYAQPIDVAALARIALMSSAHFTREFKATFGETPHRYLQRRRIERAMARLRDTDDAVTDIGLAVGFGSTGTFSRTFREIVGRSPSEYRRETMPLTAPGCVVRSWTRPFR